MSSSKQSEHITFPDPQTPVAAWVHYGIAKYAEAELQQKLAEIGYDGYLIGLRVTYWIEEAEGEEQEYTMAFGYGVSEVPPSEYEVQRENPIPYQYMNALYRRVRAMLEENMPGDVQQALLAETMDLSASLEATVSGSIIHFGYRCRRCRNGQCTRQECVGKKRLFRKNDNGKWVCTHRLCDEDDH